MTPKIETSPGARGWFDDRRALVIGLGKSGAAAARLLERLGARVSVTESRSRESLGEALRGLPSAITVEAGSHHLLGKRWDLVVPSPGVSASTWEPLRARGALVWGELELAYRALSLAGRWPRWSAAVTGTNGKTTTTALLGAIFEAAGRPTVVAGNIGTPLSDCVDRVTADTALALEVSSYQLETASAFRPTVGALLNVTPDHLGRHGTLDNYARTKFKLFQEQRGDETAVLNARDALCRALRGLAPAGVAWFGDRLPGPGLRWSASGLVGFGGRWALPAHLPGRHNGENAAAAVACARALGVPGAAVRQALSAFRGVAHRLEFIRERRGVRFINDSKATNVDSTRVALEAFPGRLRLILGGQDKGAPYTPLAGLVRRKVKEILLIGEAAPKIEKDLAGAAAFFRAGDMAGAVRRAAETATAGDIVLLSPACASFDQFENFEHRGRVFRALAEALP